MLKMQVLENVSYRSTLIQLFSPSLLMQNPGTLRHSNEQHIEMQDLYHVWRQT